MQPMSCPRNSMVRRRLSGDLTQQHNNVLRRFRIRRTYSEAEILFEYSLVTVALCLFVVFTLTLRSLRIYGRNGEAWARL